MARRSKSSVSTKLPIIYETPTDRVEYVGKEPDELWPELRRIHTVIRSCIRMLSRIRFVRHIVLVSARFQLMNSLRTMSDTASDDELAQEIARLNFLLGDTVKILDQLSNSRTPLLEELRFTLTYGQTPRRREVMGAFVE